MARYLSFHAGSEGKMTRKTIKGLSGHTFRKTEQRYKNHGNKDIDKSLTKYNSDWIQGKKSSLYEIVEERLKNEYKGKRALRKDAVVVREVIAQASPSVYEGLTLEEKRKKAIQFTKDSLKWFRKEFGSKNVVGLSVHLDETNPHTHFAIMPMTKDGRISQKDFFKGPSDLKRMHREYRKHMNDLGWEFEEENKYENVDGVSLPKYKANAKEIEKKREEQTEAIRSLLSDDEIREEARNIVINDILREERERIERKAELQKEKEKELNNRERNLDKREVILTEREKEVQKFEDVIADTVIVTLEGRQSPFPERLFCDLKLAVFWDCCLTNFPFVPSRMPANSGNLKIKNPMDIHKNTVQREHDIDSPSL